MRIIITGGTGLIGRALSADLAADGHEVIVLSRHPELAAAMPDGVRIVGWDARSADGWGTLADGADAIVNLAGASLRRRWTPRYKQVIRMSRLNAGRAVVDAVEKATLKPGVVIQASGAGAYGPRGDEVITEEAGFGDGFLGRTAAAWEASTAAVEELGVRRAIVRSGVALSMESGAFPLLALPYRFFVGGPLARGDQWLPWIHMEDEIRAIRFLAEKEAAAGPFNLSTPNPLTNAEFGRTLARILGRPALIRVPAFAVRLVLGEMSTVVLHGQRAIPKRLLDLGFEFRFSEAKAALRDLL
jgi:hypothetical protein